MTMQIGAHSHATAPILLPSNIYMMLTAFPTFGVWLMNTSDVEKDVKYRIGRQQQFFGKCGEYGYQKWSVPL